MILERMSTGHGRDQAMIDPLTRTIDRVRCWNRFQLHALALEWIFVVKVVEVSCELAWRLKRLTIVF